MVEHFRVEYESPGFVKLLLAAEHFHSLEAEVDYWNSSNHLLAQTRPNVSDPTEIFKSERTRRRNGGGRGQ